MGDRLDPRVLDLDCAAEIAEIGARLRDVVGQELHRRGAVVAVSGGVDSSVCLALAARALGPERVLALLLPERESSPDSLALGRRLVDQLHVPSVVQDITDVLEALGCYRSRDDAVREVFPAYGPGWKCKLAIEIGRAHV